MRINGSPSLRLITLALMAALSQVGCGDGPDASSNEREPLGDTANRFADFKAQLPRDPETGAYLVEGDIRVYDDQTLRTIHEQNEKRGALIINTANSADDRWPAPQHLSITYCVSTAFGANYATVVQAMADATAAWQAVSSVRFIHRSAEDGACTASNNNVVFNVRQVSGTSYNASAFFPSYARAQRELLVDWNNATNAAPKTLTGILRHELGHTLGFRHEHTRVSEGCYEDSNWRELTTYDAASVMHYRQCPDSSWNFGDYVLTDSDKAGAAAIYGYTPSMPKQLFVGFKANDTTNQLYVTGSADGVSFQTPAVGYPQITLQGSPAMAVFSNRLYVAFRANDATNALYVTSSSDGSSFGPAKGYPAIRLQGNPAMAAFNGRLYIAFRANDTSNTLYVTSSADGLNFSPATQYPTIALQGSPAMAAFNGRLYIAFRANDSTSILYVTSSPDGVSFFPTQGYPTLWLQDSPALAAFNNSLYVAFRSYDSSNALYVTSATTGYNFQVPATGYPNVTLQGGPALAAFNGRLYVAFRANDPTNALYMTSSPTGSNFQGIATGHNGLRVGNSPAIAFFSP